MVKVTIDRNNNKELISLSIKGHASSGPYGHDLVCASVSSIIFGGLNALTNPKDFVIEVKEGDVNIKPLKSANNHDLDVLETLIVQLRTVEESSPKNIKIMEKGID